MVINYCSSGNYVYFCVKIKLMSKPEYRVIIAGSRNFQDYDLLREKCDNILFSKCIDHSIVIVSGTARGADRLGERYASERGYCLRRFPAEWDKYGKAAGHIRNARMAANADALIAFWDGMSSGTRNMIDFAMIRRLAVRTIFIPGQSQDSGTNIKIGSLRNKTALYAIEHITGSGMHRGIRWLEDSFNDYHKEVYPNDKVSDEESISHRQALARKIASDCTGRLTEDQYSRLEAVLSDIVGRLALTQWIKR